MRALCALLVSSAVPRVHAQNIELAPSTATCAKIDGVSTRYLERIAEDLGLPTRLMRFEGASYQVGGCRLHFSTPQGPYHCQSSHVLSSDQGLTAFAAGHGFCEKPRR